MKNIALIIFKVLGAFSVCFFVLPAVASASDKTFCTYTKYVYPEGATEAKKITVTITGNSNETNSANLHLNVSDDMGDLGFGLNNVYDLVGSDDDFWNYSDTKKTFTVGFNDVRLGIFNGQAYSTSKYTDWVNNHSGTSKFCVPYVVVLVWVDKLSTGSETKNIFIWSAADKSEAEDFTFNSVRDTAGSHMGATTENHASVEWGLSSDLKPDEMSGPRQYYYFDKPKGSTTSDGKIYLDIKNHQYLEVLPLYEEYTASTAKAADDKMLADANKIVDNYTFIDDNNCGDDAEASGTNCGNIQDTTTNNLAVAYVRLADADLYRMEKQLTTLESKPGYEKLKELTAISEGIGLGGHYIDWAKAYADLKTASGEYNSHSCDKVQSPKCIEYAKALNKAYSTVYNMSKVYNIPNEFLKSITFNLNLPSAPIDCNDFIDASTGRNLIQEIWTLFEIAAPILLIVFGSLDFVKATAAADADALKKAGNNFMKRVIAAVLLFLIPFIVSFILTSAGVWGNNVPAVCVEGK